MGLASSGFFLQSPHFPSRGQFIPLHTKYRCPRAEPNSGEVGEFWPNITRAALIGHNGGLSLKSYN